MYRALYRKWRPQKFADVVGQEAIVTALRNQLAAGRIGHAYLFTGTRGTGKTTCAKIFAKAVNCLHPDGADPCGVCPACRGIDDGSILDVLEIDAASNNSVDDIRDLRDETAYLPAACKYKVYIIDEVHMLSGAAFNALLKTMEEPPEHVIFILATTEVNKIPATILSRCQRYDFTRITADKIAARLLYVAGQEDIRLSDGTAALIGRLADGAMRDALSILDTCAGVSADVDEALVRRMAGVTDRQYLFAISDAVAAGDSVAALGKVAELRQDSVDMRLLCTELAGHYRNLMLVSVPGGEKLLTGTAPEEDAAYAARKDTPRRACVRAVETFGRALERMGTGADPRLELELALFTLTEPEPAAVQPAAPAAAQSTAPQPFAAAPAPQPFASAPAASAAPAPAAPPEEVPPFDMAGAEPDLLQPARKPAPRPAESAPRPAPAPKQPAPAYTADVPIPAPAAPRAPAAGAAQTPLRFAQWPAVLARIAESDPLLNSFLHDSTAYFDGKRVLIDCGDAFREFMRRNRETGKRIREYIYQVTGVNCFIGPWEPPPEGGDPAQRFAETMQTLGRLGVDVDETDS